ncbi:hypothetical protein NA57DRAFT_50197 [Rhizodiscina lignyota]|uniref:50S ribosomal protein YmL27 n=1 Tax=Rhizodiscina lignyota TaxID=1504668 RepID=A0A9P4M0M9_9PEZI|nr:hypothetical protein NA57DRAFT_50197 [Rhizodiscina lignyota]
MFYPTQPLLKAIKRLQLTTKQARKGYYKGNRTGSMGTFGKFGKYKLDASKVRTYIVPDGLADFELTPFVTEKIDRPHAIKRGMWWDPQFAITGERYLQRWKEENGA